MADEFEELVDKLEKEIKELPINERKRIIDEVCEDYIEEHGKKPNSYQLMRLGNILLHEDLSNPDSYKVQNEDYPFHSHSQEKRRKRREFTAMDSTLEFMEFKSNENLSTAPEEKDLR